MLLKSCFCCMFCSCMYVLKLTSINKLLDEAELHNHQTSCLMYQTWSGKIIKMCTVHQGFSTNSLFQQWYHHGDPCSLGPVEEQTQSLSSLLYQPQLGEYVQTLISSLPLPPHLVANLLSGMSHLLKTRLLTTESLRKLPSMRPWLE